MVVLLVHPVLAGDIRRGEEFSQGLVPAHWFWNFRKVDAVDCIEVCRSCGRPLKIKGAINHQLDRQVNHLISVFENTDDGFISHLTNNSGIEVPLAEQG